MLSKRKNSSQLHLQRKDDFPQRKNLATLGSLKDTRTNVVFYTAVKKISLQNVLTRVITINLEICQCKLNIRLYAIKMRPFFIMLIITRFKFYSSRISLG